MDNSLSPPDELVITRPDMWGRWLQVREIWTEEHSLRFERHMCHASLTYLLAGLGSIGVMLKLLPARVLQELWRASIDSRHNAKLHNARS